MVRLLEIIHLSDAFILNLQVPLRRKRKGSLFWQTALPHIFYSVKKYTSKILVWNQKHTHTHTHQKLLDCKTQNSTFWNIHGY